MVEVRLHGALARDFGRIWSLDIQSPHEAVSAIEAGKRGFRAAIMKLSQAGMVFRVRSKEHDYTEDDIDMRLGSVSRIDIIPIICGASAGVRFIVGAVLVAVGYLVPGAQVLIPVGASLMLGAVTEWLTPKVQRETNADKNLQSWSINGPTNLAEQGMPVPVIYGEVLTGAYPISAGLSTAQMNPAGGITPSVVIGGEANIMQRAAVRGTTTVIVALPATPYNLDEPLTFNWSFSGFNAASARRLIQQGGISRLELDYEDPGTLAAISDTGTLSVVCTGTDRSLGPGTQTSVSASRAINITADYRYLIAQYWGSL